VRPFVWTVVVTGVLLLGCGGDRTTPSETPSSLALAGSPCKSTDFVTAVGMYASAAVRRDLEDRCKNALAADSKGNLKEGPIIFGILAKLFTDWQTGDVLQALSGKTFEESLVFFIGATCGLDQKSPFVGCQVPELAEINSWGAWGPVSNLDQGINDEESFAWRFDDCNGVYITVSSRPLGTLGVCPGTSDVNNNIDSSPHDCQGDEVFDFHAFDPDGAGVGAFLNQWTAETCPFEIGEGENEVVFERHLRCPNGQCEFGLPGALTDLLLNCGGASADLSGWRGLVYQATRPIQWILQATPAYGGGGAATTFDGTSPIVLGDLDPRLREVVCSVTAGYNNGSEGTTCQLLEGGPQGTVYESCVTVADPDDSTSAECSMFPIVPDLGIDLTPKAFKTGSGAFVQVGAAFTLEPDAPAPGQSVTVTFNLAPPGQQ
jgi:hypothetical protein